LVYRAASSNPRKRSAVSCRSNTPHNAITEALFKLLLFIEYVKAQSAPKSHAYVVNGSMIMRVKH
jgi:hypothetical protein